MVPDTSVWHSGTAAQAVTQWHITLRQWARNKISLFAGQISSRWPNCQCSYEDSGGVAGGSVTCVKCLRCPLMGGGLGSRWLCCICKMPQVSTDGFTTAQGGWGSRWLCCICKMFQVSTDKFTTAQGRWGSRWLCYTCKMSPVSTDGSPVHSRWLYYTCKLSQVSTDGTPVYSRWLYYTCKLSQVSTDGTPVYSRWLCYTCKMSQVFTDGTPVHSRWLCYTCKMHQESTEKFTAAQGPLLALATGWDLWVSSVFRIATPPQLPVWCTFSVTNEQSDSYFCYTDLWHIFLSLSLIIHNTDWLI